MAASPQSFLDLPGIKKLRSGKVREVFDLGETLLFVATDRLSAFDVILPDPIPHKGAVLNQLSAFWFKRFDKIDNHFVTADFDEFPQELRAISRSAGRSLDDRPQDKAAAGGMRRPWVSGRLRLEGISGIAKRLRRKVAAGIATGLAIAGANFYSRDEERRRTRPQHRHERVSPKSWAMKWRNVCAA